MTYATFDALVIPRGAKHKREAFQFLAYLNRGDAVVLNNTLLFALTMQTMTIALLIMSRGR